MTERSAPWNGVVTGDATLAPYSSTEWAAIWRDIVLAAKVNEGPIIGSGVSPDPGLTVSPTTPVSASVNVSVGSAIVRGTWYNNDAVQNLAVGANASGSIRIDTVVLRKNYTTQTIRLAVLPGTPGSGVPPTLTQTEGAFWEIPLADIELPNGYATIPQSYITLRRHWAGASDGVYLLDILNNSGVPLSDGMPVIWDSSTDRAVTLTAILNDYNIAGIWQGYTPAGGYGRLLVRGIGYIKTNGVIVRGNVLCTYLTPGVAYDMAAATPSDSKYSGLGIALENKATSGYCLSYIDVQPHRPHAYVIAAPTDFGITTSNVFADVHANDKISIVTHTGRVKVTWHCQGKITVAGDAGDYDIYSVGLAARASGIATGLQRFADSAFDGNYRAITLVAIFDGLAVNTLQEFRLQHRVEAGTGTLTTSADHLVYAEEI